MTALIVTPPLFRFKPAKAKAPTIFLAGSIEMGAAEEWQTHAIETLKEVTSIIYNPRRANWDATWEQKIDHPEFNVQVNWELDMIDKADLVLFHFDPNTKSPVTMMELGYLARRTYSTFVSCPEGFWRKGNVDIICERNEIAVFGSLEDALDAAKVECQRRIMARS